MTDLERLKELAAMAKSESPTSGAVHALIEAIEAMADRPDKPPLVVEPPAKPTLPEKPTSPPPGKPLVPPSIVEKGKK